MFIAGHLSENVLEQYAMHRLSETEEDAVDDHLSLCSHCQTKLDEHIEMIQVLRIAEKMSPVQDSGRLRLPAWLQAGWGFRVWAGAAALAGGLVLAVALETRTTAPGNLTMVKIEGTRGGSTVVHGEGPFDFELFMPAAAQTYRVDLLGGSGEHLWHGDVAGHNGTLHVIVKLRIATGQYYLHVTEPKAGSQHDYGVRVEK